MVVMFPFIAVMMILVIIMMRVRGMVHLNVMPGKRFGMIVDDHRIHPNAPNRVNRDTYHHQNPQDHRAGEPRMGKRLMV